MPKQVEILDLSQNDIGELDDDCFKVCKFILTIYCESKFYIFLHYPGSKTIKNFDVGEQFN